MTRRFLVVENRFLAFSSLGRVPEGSRTASGGSGDPPEHDSGRIFLSFSARSFTNLTCVACVASSAEVLSGYTANLWNSLSGVLLGYGDLAKRFKFKKKDNI